MKMLGLSKKEIEEKSAIFTITEIMQQPKTFVKTINQIKENSKEIEQFINNVTKQQDYDIIFTGAGTSEFIGNSLYAGLNKQFNYKVKSYGTTDIVASPEDYLSKTKPTLLISFGRSGNSPESIGAVQVANKVCKNVYHLFVTCNKDGNLSKMAQNLNNAYAINLTDETHDKSFAMTSSFTNMYLAAYLSLNIENIENIEKRLLKLIEATTRFLENDYTFVENIIKNYDFDRVVYLGSNTLKGVSQESTLKLLELTAGRIVSIFDTPLGFRHGPKSIINDSTLTVVYVSNDSYTYQYELDLIKEISSQKKGNKLAVISDKYNEELKALSDFYYAFEIGEDSKNIELGLAYILFAQVLSVLKSLSLSITPDNPCPSGEVNRVVKGVILYDYEK